MFGKICKCALLFVVAGLSPLSAQEAATLYFLDKNPTLHQLNPAFRPEGRFYIGMPGLSSLHFAAGNNCLTFGDLFQGAVVDGERQTVSFLSRYADNGIDNFLEAMDDDLRLYSEYNLSVLSFGLMLNQKHYLTFGLSNKADIQFLIPKSIPVALLKGNPDVDARRSFGIDDLSLAASLYSELSLGYSQRCDEKLSVGGKLKILFGHANVRTDFREMSLTIDKDEWKLTGSGAVEMSAPGLRLQKADDGTLDGFDFDGGSVSDDGLVNGLGAAVDLGAAYRLLPGLRLSASLLDFGMIRWNRNLRSLKKKTDFVFNGVVYEIEDRDTVDYIGEYEDILKRMYTVNNKADAYRSWLTAKVLLGAEYALWEDRLAFGLLSKTSILQSNLYEEVMLSANFKPWRVFSAALSYSLIGGEWHNVGLAANFNFGPVNYYLALDQVPLEYAVGGGLLLPTKTRGANFSMGWNYVFGYKERKSVDEVLPDVPISEMEVGAVAESVADSVDDDLEILPVDTLVRETRLGDSVVALLPVVDSVAVVKDSVVSYSSDSLPSDSVARSASGRLIDEALYGIRYSLDGHLMVLDSSSFPLLEKIVLRMKENPGLRLSIRSHFHLDERGREFSSFMSRERSHLVVNYLVERGVAANRIIQENVGADEPVSTNKTLRGRAKNRRMELRYVE